MMYAKQVNPRYQESPIDELEESFHLVIDGGRHFVDVNEDLLKETVDFCYYLVNFCSEDEKLLRYEIEELHKDMVDYNTFRQWLNIAKTFDSDSYYSVANAFSLYYGGNWTYKYIRGNSQSEWAVCYFDKDVYSDDDIEHIEAVYFNTGTEWIIHEGYSEPKCAEEIFGSSVYITEYDAKKTLEDMFGEQFVLYEYAGEKVITVYEKR